jgi:hypothetical protein
MSLADECESDVVHKARRMHARALVAATAVPMSEAAASGSHG